MNFRFRLPQKKKNNNDNNGNLFMDSLPMPFTTASSWFMSNKHFSFEFIKYFQLFYYKWNKIYTYICMNVVFIVKMIIQWREHYIDIHSFDSHFTIDNNHSVSVKIIIIGVVPMWLWFTSSI